MTKHEFEKLVTKDFWKEQWVNYFSCIGLIAAGIYLIYDWTSALNTENFIEIIFLLLPIAIIAFGIYGFWRIPVGYKVYEYKSSLPAKEKMEVIERFLSQKRYHRIDVYEDDTMRLYYGTKFFSDNFIKAYIDDEKYLFRVYYLNEHSGFIDFGSQRRTSKRILKYLQQRG